MVAAVLLWVVVTCLVGYLIGNSRGRGTEGVFFGLLLGPIGWIITLLFPEAGAKCPECKGVVPTGARRCKHCGVVFSRPVAPAADPSKFFVLVNDKTDGPFSLEQLRYLTSRKTITRETLCAREGDSQWLPLGDFL